MKTFETLFVHAQCLNNEMLLIQSQRQRVTNKNNYSFSMLDLFLKECNICIVFHVEIIVHIYVQTLVCIIPSISG